MGTMNEKNNLFSLFHESKVVNLQTSARHEITQNKSKTELSCQNLQKLVVFRFKTLFSTWCC